MVTKNRQPLNAILSNQTELLTPGVNTTFTLTSAVNTVGKLYTFINNGTANVVLQAFDASAVVTVAPGKAVIVTPSVDAPTTSGNWANLSSSPGQVPVGAVVGTFPNLAGAYSCAATTVPDSAGYVKCQGQTIADPTSPMNGTVIPNINNGTFLAGAASSGSTTLLGTAAGPSVALVTANVPGHTHAFTTTAHTHTFSFSGGTGTAAAQAWAGLVSGTNVASGVSGTVGTVVAAGGSSYISRTAGPGTIVGEAVSGTAAAQSWSGSVSGTNSTSAVTGVSGSGTTGGTGTSGTTDTGSGSSTAFSILPTYLTAVYVMRAR